MDTLITAAVAAASAAAWPLLVSFVGVLLTYWATRRGQAGQERRDRSSEQTDFRRDVLAENRDLRERLGAAEKQNLALDALLDASRREVLTLKTPPPPIAPA